MYGLFGVRTWCKWALESDSPWLMWTRIPYSARIGLPVRQYVGEAARKPILPLRKNTDGRKKTEKTARNATEFLISVDLGKVWPPLIRWTRWVYFWARTAPVLCKNLTERTSLGKYGDVAEKPYNNTATMGIAQYSQCNSLHHHMQSLRTLAPMLFAWSSTTSTEQRVQKKASA